jgi:hypothetical protein
MRRLFRRLPGMGLSVLVLCMVFLTATAVAGNANGNGSNNSGSNNSGSNHSGGGDNGSGTAPAVPASGNAAPTSPPGQANNPNSAAPSTPPGQSENKPGATPATPAGSGTPATPATPAQPAAPTPVPAAVAPVIGESMALKPVKGTVQVRLPQSTGYVSLDAAGSIPSGAVIDARAGTVVLRSAVNAKGATQTATIRGAVFEVRQSPTANGMTDLVLKGGRPAGCPSTTAATVRAAMAHGIATKAKAGSSSAMWAKDRSRRFRSRGRNSVATVRGTRWVTTDTCAGTRTTVTEGSVSVRDVHRKRSVLVRAGHSYLARSR